MWFLLLFMFSLHAGDFTLEMASAGHMQISDEDIAETLMNGFFMQNGKRVRSKIRPILIEYIKREEDAVRIVLSHAALAPAPPISASNNPLNVKMFELLSEAIDEAIAQDERKSQEREQEYESRCKRGTVFILSGLLGLGGAAIGAAITAAITASLS